MQAIDESAAAYFELAALAEKYDFLRYILRHQSPARAGESSRVEYMSRDVRAVGSMDNSLGARHARSHARVDLSARRP